MRKQVFNMNWSDRFKNVRNMIAGTANAKESFPERWADIDFVAYEVAILKEHTKMHDVKNSETEKCDKI